VLLQPFVDVMCDAGVERSVGALQDVHRPALFVMTTMKIVTMERLPLFCCVGDCVLDEIPKFHRVIHFFRMTKFMNNKIINEINRKCDDAIIKT